MTYTVRVRGTPSGLMCQEYWCEPCDDRFAETVERPAPTFFACPHCGEMAEAVISAPKLKRSWGGPVNTGRKQDAPSPLVMDTEPLADGEPYHEWRAKRRKVHDEERRARIKKNLG